MWDFFVFGGNRRVMSYELSVGVRAWVSRDNANHDFK